MRSESEREVVNWPSTEGMSSTMVLATGLGAIISGSVESLLEWPNERSLGVARERKKRARERE